MSVAIENTMETIRTYALQGSRRPDIRELGERIVSAVPARDGRAELEALFHYVVAEVRETRDPYNVELIRTAPAILERRVADCDDFAVVLGALAMTVGYPARVVAYSPSHRPDTFKHVAVEANAGGTWLALDPIAGGFAARPRDFARRITLDIVREPVMSTVGGLGETIFGEETWGDISGTITDVIDFGGQVARAGQQVQQVRRAFGWNGGGRQPAGQPILTPAATFRPAIETQRPDLLAIIRGLGLKVPGAQEHATAWWGDLPTIGKAAIIGGGALAVGLMVKGVMR